MFCWRLSKTFRPHRIFDDRRAPRGIHQHAHNPQNLSMTPLRPPFKSDAPSTCTKTPGHISPVDEHLQRWKTVCAHQQREADAHGSIGRSPPVASPRGRISPCTGHTCIYTLFRKRSRVSRSSPFSFLFLRMLVQRFHRLLCPRFLTTLGKTKRLTKVSERIQIGWARSVSF